MTPLDALLDEADRIGLRLTLENGKVKVRFTGSDDRAAETLLRKIHVHGSELAERLAERPVPTPAPVVVRVRREVSETVPEPPPEAPAPVVVSSRSFSDGEIAFASGAVPVRVERALDSLDAVLGTSATFAAARRLGYVK